MTEHVTFQLQNHVATVRLARPPHNYVDQHVLRELADTLGELDARDDCRAVVLAADGRSFCAGADFGDALQGGERPDSAALYAQAVRLYQTRKPIVAAIQGPAIGAGVGLALVGDFRIASPAARFSVSFNRLGFHPGFGLSHTLPRLLGVQQAALLFYTGRRLKADEALRIGLVDEVVPEDQLQDRAAALASEIATSAPAAVQDTRATLRRGLAEAIAAATAHELAVQNGHFAMNDFQEGIRAVSERRPPAFTGR